MYQGHFGLQELPFGILKTGIWLETADTGPRARYDYDATLSLGQANKVVDYRQPVLAGVPHGELFFAGAFVIVLVSLVVQGWTVEYEMLFYLVFAVGLVPLIT